MHKITVITWIVVIALLFTVDPTTKDNVGVNNKVPTGEGQKFAFRQDSSGYHCKEKLKYTFGENGNFYRGDHYIATEPLADDLYDFVLCNNSDVYVLWQLVGAILFYIASSIFVQVKIWMLPRLYFVLELVEPFTTYLKEVLLDGLKVVKQCTVYLKASLKETAATFNIEGFGLWVHKQIEWACKLIEDNLGPVRYVLCVVLIIVVIGLLNYIYFVHLCKSDVKETVRKPRPLVKSAYCIRGNTQLANRIVRDKRISPTRRASLRHKLEAKQNLSWKELKQCMRLQAEFERKHGSDGLKDTAWWHHDRQPGKSCIAEPGYNRLAAACEPGQGSLRRHRRSAANIKAIESGKDLNPEATCDNVEKVKEAKVEEEETAKTQKPRRLLPRPPSNETRPDTNDGKRVYISPNDHVIRHGFYDPPPPRVIYEMGEPLSGGKPTGTFPKMDQTEEEYWTEYFAYQESNRRKIIRGVGAMINLTAKVHSLVIMGRLPGGVRKRPVKYDSDGEEIEEDD